MSLYQGEAVLGLLVSFHITEKGGAYFSLSLEHHTIFMVLFTSLCQLSFYFIFIFYIILYVNCFGRTMLYMCIEYHI